MKCMTSTSDLKGAIELLRLAAKESPISPTSGSVMIEAQKEPPFLHLRTDNGRTNAQAKVIGKVGQEGTVVISAERLYRILSLASGDSVRLYSEDGHIAKIEVGDTKATLPCWPKEEFLSRITPDNSSTNGAFRWEVSLSILKSSLQDIKACWQKDSVNGLHYGIHFLGDREHLKIEACDGRMLHMSFLKSELPVDAKVDPEFIDLILALSAEDEEQNCTLIFQENACTIELGDIVLRSQLLEGQYPDTSRNLVGPSENVIVLPKDQLVRALKVVQVVMSAREIATVKIESFPDQVVLTSTTPEIGQVREVINVENLHTTMFNIDAQRLLSTLKCVKGDEVVLQVDDPLNSMIIYDDNFIGILALIRTFEQVSASTPA